MINGYGLQLTAVVGIICLIVGYGAGSLFTSASTGESIKELEVEISSLKDTVASMDLRVTTLQEQVDENQQIIQSNEVTISHLNTQVIELESEFDNWNTQVADLRSQISEAENLELVDVLESINALDYRMDRSEAYRILRKTMSKPGDYLVDSLTDHLFEDLKGRYPQVGSIEGLAKQAITKAINAKTPSLVWYGRSCDRINSYLYDTYVVTYFPLEIDLPVIGDIVIARVAVVVKGEVNVNQNIVMENTLELYSLDIEES